MGLAEYFTQLKESVEVFDKLIKNLPTEDVEIVKSYETIKSEITEKINEFELLNEEFMIKLVEFEKHEETMDTTFAKLRKMKKKSTKESVEVYVKGSGKEKMNLLEDSRVRTTATLIKMIELVETQLLSLSERLKAEINIKVKFDENVKSKLISTNENIFK